MKHYIKKLIIGAVSGLFLGFIAYQYQPITWKANALLSLASYKPDSDSPFIALESTSVTIERLKNKSFLLETSQRVQSQYRPDFLKTEVAVKVIRGRTPDELSGLVLSINGYSSDYVSNALSSVVQELKSKHQQLIDNYRNNVNSQLGKFESATLAINNAHLNAKNCDDNSRRSSDVTAILTILEQTTQLFKLQYIQHEATLISSYNLRNTTELEPIYITQEKLFNTLPLALLTGIFLGVFAVFVFSEIKKYRSNHFNSR